MYDRTKYLVESVVPKYFVGSEKVIKEHFLYHFSQKPGWHFAGAERRYEVENI